MKTFHLLTPLTITVSQQNPDNALYLCETKQLATEENKQINGCLDASQQHIENLGAMPQQESLGAMPRRHIVALWSRLLNEKQQICGLMADLTEQAMTANDANERLTVHSRENLISALFYS